jgi:MFS family permease
LLRVLTRPRGLSKKNVFYGWWIVAAGSISQAYTSGTFWQGFGAFFDPIVNSFGWSRAVTAAALSIQRTESGMISPFVGYFLDKFGPRKVMIAGILATGLGFILLSRIESLWQFYAAFVLITLGLSFGTFLVVTTTVANWFVAQRTRAMSIASAGSALGGLLVPVVVWLIAATDWRTALMVIGIGFWVMGIPVALAMRSRPEDYGLLPDGRRPGDDAAAKDAQKAGPKASAAVASLHSSTRVKPSAATEVTYTIKEALKTRSFWQMALAMGASQLIMSASVFQIPAMNSFGISREVAGLVILAVSLVSLTGRLGSGVMGDRMDKRQVIAIAFTSQLIGTIIFAFSSEVWHLVGFILFWGFGFGASIPVRFALIADYFGRRHFGSIMGTMMTVSTVFGVVGPVFVGWMFDLRHNYRDPFLLLSFTILVSIPMILTLAQPRQRRQTA